MDAPTTDLGPSHRDEDGDGCLHRALSRMICSVRSLWNIVGKHSGHPALVREDISRVSWARPLCTRVWEDMSFEHGYIETTHAHEHKVEHVTYSEGYLFACARQEVSVWEVECGALRLQFRTESRIVCVHAAARSALVTGHRGGCASLWSLRGGHVVRTLRVDAHAEVALVAHDATLGILATGHDHPARLGLWCAASGSLLHQLHVGGAWVALVQQVTILPAEGAINKYTLWEGHHSLLVKAVSRSLGCSIALLYSWPSHELVACNSSACQHGRVSTMQGVVVQTWSEQADGCTRSCHVFQGRLMCAPQGSGNRLLVYDINTRQLVMEVRTGFLVRNIVAAGSRYTIIEGQWELAVMDLTSHDVVALWSLTYERFVTGIVCGNTSWLNCVENCPHDRLLLAVHGGWFGGRDGFQTICWQGHTHHEKRNSNTDPVLTVSSQVTRLLSSRYKEKNLVECLL